MTRLPLLLLLVLCPGLAIAAQPDIKIEAAWARATPPGGNVGVMYMTVTNSGAVADRLIAISTPAAERAEMHIEIHEGSVVQMRPVATVDVKPGERVVFKPNGLHIMLVGLVRPLRRGDHLPLTITFEKAGRLDADVVVLPAGASGYP